MFLLPPNAAQETDMIWAYYIAVRCSNLKQTIFNGFTLSSGNNYTLLSVHVFMNVCKVIFPTFYGVLPMCQVLITYVIPMNFHNDSVGLEGGV